MMDITERLSAYLDGALDPAEMAAVETDAARDPAVAAELARLQDHDAVLRQAFDAPMGEDVPEHLLAMLRPAASKAEAKVFNLAAEREKRAVVAAPEPRSNIWRYVTAMAATLVVGLFVGTQMPRGGEGGDPLATSLAFNKTLDATPSARTVALNASSKLTPVLSFARGDGQFCRQFTLAGPARQHSGIACHGGKGWSVEALVPHTPATSAGGYQTAGGAEDDELDAVFTTLKAGDPLDAAAEQAMIRSGWQAKK